MKGIVFSYTEFSEMISKAKDIAELFAIWDIVKETCFCISETRYHLEWMVTEKAIELNS